MKKSISVKAYAKINLSLDVLKRMENGYHMISTIMQQIDLADQINIESLGKAGMLAGYNIKLLAEDSALPENKEDNLVYKAAKLMAETFCPLKDNKLKITLNKKIPIAAGLAGGSSDAAAVMLGLCHLWNINIPLKDLCKIGKNIGADIPFCLIANAKNNPALGFSEDDLSCSAALAEGIGDILTPVSPLTGKVVLVKPDIHVPTPDVYSKLVEYNSLPEQNPSLSRPDTESMVQALKEKNTQHITKNMINILETVSLKEYPIVMYTKNKIDESAAPVKVLMSGSGPTVFAYYTDEKSAQRGYESCIDEFLSNAGSSFQVYLASLL